MNFGALLAFGSAVVAGAIAVGVLLRWDRTLALGSFAAGMVALGLEGLFVGLSLTSAEPRQMVHWQVFRLQAYALLPGAWLLFSLCYARGNYQEFLRKWWPVVASAFVVPLVLLFSSADHLIVSAQANGPAGDWFLVLGWAGVGLHLTFLLTAVLMLMNLEATFRAAVGTMRWRIKFMVLGLGLLFVVRLYTGTQALLYNGSRLSLQVVNAGALCLAGGLIAWALLRSKVFATEIYPSQTVLHRSLVVLLAGVYLLIVGVLAEVVTRLGGVAAFPLKAFLVLVAVVLLSMLFLSDRVQQRTKRFISRHFHRPLYDYRTLWMAFTERTTSLLDEGELCRAFARAISETFDVLSVTVWLLDPKTQRLTFVASTSLPESKALDLMDPHADQSELVAVMRAKPYPIDIDQTDERWSAVLKRCNPDYFGKGGHRLCVPLVAGGEPVGVITLADRVSGVPFTVEDFDLLKCIGDQVAAGLLNIQLSQRLLQAKEMEAFQTMSAFLVHDLKNTASTLSLLLQNLQTHFDDPAFRQDALRAVSKSVNHINDLISRLSLLRHKLEIKPVAADLNEVVGRVLSELERDGAVVWEKELRPLPPVRFDPEQIQKVVLNLFLNAKDAVGTNGRIRVETAQREGWAVLSVADNGCGMSADFLARSLFRPFQTTKKNGTGIGMFHTKMIVEAHRGRIEAESQVGKGTTFRVRLPLGV
jgi:putative PEP-CTERM system histidine kinase